MIDTTIKATVDGVRINFRVDDASKVSDGYHTFEELYDHRITLYIALCRWLASSKNCEEFVEATDGGIPVWRSKLHSDGTMFDGQFILGIRKEKGRQISYHLPLSRWKETSFAQTLKKAPEWDGHTSNDVVERLKHL